MKIEPQPAPTPQEGIEVSSSNARGNTGNTTGKAAPQNAAAILALTAVALVLVLGSLIVPADFVPLAYRPVLRLVMLILLLVVAALALLSLRASRQVAHRLEERIDALRDNETSLRGILWGSQQAVCVIANERHVQANAAYAKMFGYSTPEELIGLPVTQTIAPSDLETIRGMAAEAVARGVGPNLYVTRGLRKNGKEFLMELRISLYHLNGDTRFLCMVRDISEELRAEQEFKDSEQRYRLMFEDNPTPMWVYDVETLEFLAVNDAAVAHYGYSREEFLAMTLNDIRVLENVPAFVNNSSNAPQGLIRSGGWRHRKKDGTLIHIEITAHRMLFAGRRAHLALITDITENLRAAAQLEEERVFYRKVIDAVPELIYVKDGDGRYVLANQAVADDNDMRPDEMVGRVDAEFLHDPDDAQRFHEESREVIATRQPVYLPEEMVPRRDGSPRWLTTVKVPLVDARGDCCQVLGVSIDITARKEAEAEVQRLNQELEHRVEERTRQLQETIQDLDAFSYSVSHDLRTPMRAMSEFASVLLEDAGPHLSEEEREDLAIIRGSALRMTQMLDGLLSFARMGRQALDLQPVDVSAMVDVVLKELAPQRDGRQVKVEVGDLLPCSADPILLRQVWTNLLSNALKFTRQCEEALVEVGSRPDEAGRPVYFVRDNGVGFDMQFAGRLFGVFQRLHRSEDFEGAGVGLAIVQRIIHRHGGAVWAESRPGRGAAFYFRLS